VKLKPKSLFRIAQKYKSGIYLTKTFFKILKLTLSKTKTKEKDKKKVFLSYNKLNV
jgi:hypothetical protein